MDVEREMYADDWAIGEMLDKDADGRMLKDMRDVLIQRRAAVRTELDRGVTPDEFTKGQALVAGYDAALKGLELAWDRRHGAT